MNLFKYTKSPLVAGTLVLTITGIVSKIIGFYYRIFLSRSIGAEQLGIYQLIFPLFAVVISISCAGIQTAISKYTAEFIGRKDLAPARTYLYVGLGMSMILSVLCAILIYTHADFFADTFLKEARCEPLIRIMCWTIPFACIHNCISGFYYGLKKTAIPAASQLLEQVVRVGGVYIICHIWLTQGKEPNAMLGVFGLLIGELASSLFCITALRIGKSSGGIRFAFRNLLSLSIPLTANRILVSVFQSVETLMIPVALRDFGYDSGVALSIYGVLTGMVISTIMFPCVISNSLSVMLLPAISHAKSQHNHKKIRLAIQKTFMTCLMLGLVCTLGFLIFGNWIGTTLFHNALAGAYITTLGWICPFLFLGSTFCSILHGLGKPTQTLFLSLMGIGIRIFFIRCLMPQFGMHAYLWGMLISQSAMAMSAVALVLRQTRTSK